MKDQNFFTIGGRVTHAPGIYSTNNQGFCSPSPSPTTPISRRPHETALEVKVADLPSLRTAHPAAHDGTPE